MKKTFLFLLFSFVIQLAFSDCLMSGMEFFPKQKEISLHSNFIIQGYAMSQKTINSFKERKIYLESKDGDLIELTLQEILKGQMALTQAIFKPSKKLEPNTFYFLKYTNQTESEIQEMKQWNSEKKEMEYVYWKTTDKKFLPTLNPEMKVEFEKTEVVQYGCGPSANAIFNIKNKTETEIWYKTEVIELSTNIKTTFYIGEWKGKLNVGHDMCSGAFIYKHKGKYKVRFTPMNTDGKPLKTTKWKVFESPYVTAKH